MHLEYYFQIYMYSSHLFPVFTDALPFLLASVCFLFVLTTGASMDAVFPLNLFSFVSSFSNYLALALPILFELLSLGVFFYFSDVD